MSIVSVVFPVFTGEQKNSTHGSHPNEIKGDGTCADSQRCYRGVWGLIQAQISQIDFDYASYAELRLGEYWGWKREVDGSRKKAGEEMPLREQRWAQEA